MAVALTHTISMVPHRLRGRVVEHRETKTWLIEWKWIRIPPFIRERGMVVEFEPYQLAVTNQRIKGKLIGGDMPRRVYVPEMPYVGVRILPIGTDVEAEFVTMESDLPCFDVVTNGRILALRPLPANE